MNHDYLNPLPGLRTDGTQCVSESVFATGTAQQQGRQPVRIKRFFALLLFALLPIISNAQGFISSVTNPALCGGTDGSITFDGLNPNSVYYMHYDLGGVTHNKLLPTDFGGQAILTNLSGGVYTNLNWAEYILGGTGSSDPGPIIFPDGTPAVSASSNTPVCENGTLNLGAIATGVTYSWSGPNGFTSTDQNPFINSATLAAAGTYSLMVTDNVNTCTNHATTTATVNPTPDVVASPDYVFCNGDITPTFSFTGSVSGTTFDWTNNNPSIGLSAFASGDIAPFAVINSTTAQITATITVTPTANSCPGTPQSFTITVNPTPTVDPIADQIVCNNDLTAMVHFTGLLSGTAFDWSNDNSAIGIGLASNNGDIASFTATNSGTAPVMAAFTVTPTANNCPGMSQSFSMTVNPTPSVDPIADQTPCNNALTSVVYFSGPVPGTTFNWTNDNSAVGIGVSSGNVDIAGFYATNSGTTPATATFTVVPTANNCPGSPVNFAITVNPTPDVTKPGDQFWCNNDPTTTVNFAGTVNGTVFNWINSDPSIGLAASGNGDIATFNLTNSTNALITSTITVTPSINGCPGASQDFFISVNPTPDAIVIPNNPMVCNNTAVSTTFSSSVSGATFAWTNNDPSIGLGVSGIGDIAPTTLTNGTSAVVTATVTVTPSFNGCPGNSNDFTISVNPTPDVNVPAILPLCNNGTTSASFTGLVNGTVFDWTNSDPSIGLLAAGTGDITTFNVMNSTNAMVTATITVTPSINGCFGASTDFSISVNPTPDAIVPASYMLCNNDPTSATISSSVSGTALDWTNDNTSIGLAANGTGDITSFTVTNSTTSIQMATITVMPSINGCPGTSADFTVSVNPIPDVSIPSILPLCNNDLTATSFSGSVSGTTFDWTNNDPSIGLAAMGTGDIAAFNVTNSTSAIVTATITVVPSINNCPGLSQDLTITVNPTPDVTASSPTFCNGDPMASLSFSGSVFGTSYDWTNDNINIGIVASGSGNILPFTATNSASAIDMGNISVTPTANGCQGNMQIFTITVNPTPDMVVPADQPLCNGSATNPVNFVGSVLGTAYTWSNSASIGLATTGTGDIASFTAVNTFTVAVVDTITVVPSANGCAGSPVIFTVTVNPTPTAISGPSDVCATSTITMTNGVAGGNWTIDNTSIATIGLGSGVVTGAAAGNAMVTYTLPEGCNTSAAITVNPLPGVFSVTGGGNYCSADTGVHVGLSGSENGIWYQLYNGTSRVASPFAGSGAVLDFGLHTTSGTYTAKAINPVTGCTVNMTLDAKVSVTPSVTPAVTISTGSAGTANCPGTVVLFTAAQVNGGSTPSYQWTVNGTAVGTNSPTYSYAPVHGNTVAVTLTSNAACATVAMINDHVRMDTMAVLTPDVNISVVPGASVCEGTAVTFTASPFNEGSAPTYTWVVNGMTMGGSSTHTFVPAHGDKIYVVMHSSYQCLVSNDVTSSVTTMTVSPIYMPTAIIIADPGQVVPRNQSVTLTAAVINGGPAPVYQWFKNGGVISGATNAVYVLSTPSAHDSMAVQVIGTGSCSMSTFNSMVISSSTVGAGSITAEGSVSIFPNPNKGSFTIKGSMGISSEEISLELTDVIGQVVYRTKFMSENGNVDEAVQPAGKLPSGMYLLTLHSASESKVFHLVIEE